jgi:argininosuccinate synthase
MTAIQPGSEPILLAFSGGLDTSFLVPWLKENYKRPVITVTVDTGGIDADAAKVLDQRARALGAQDHILVEAKRAYFDQVIKFLIMGNVKRGQMYPLCVGAERVMQAQTISEYSRKIGAKVVAHGCTAAGNDQVRFEVALRTLAPELTILAPVRDQAFKRPEQLEYLKARKLPIPPYGAAYSVNRGLWGVTIGGKETLTSEGSIPDDAWVLSQNAFARPHSPEAHTIGFTQGVPSSLDGVQLDPVSLIENVEAIGARYGVGRGVHLGDTIIGTKGRVAFEAPAAEALIGAHRELEKLVMTGRQQRVKEMLSGPYGDLVHEGQHLDPVCRDIEALFVASQARVTGDVKVLYRPGAAFVEGVSSPYSMMAASKGVYGEAAGEWTASDALGFSKMVGLPGMFWVRAGKKGSGTGD